MNVTDEMVEAYRQGAEWPDVPMRDDVRAGLQAVLDLIDPVPAEVHTITDADGDEWYRVSKYSDDRDALVWRHDLGYLSPATAGWIQREHGPITWEGKQ